MGNLPNLPSLAYLNMSNCTIKSILEGNDDKAPLEKLVMSGAMFVDDYEAFMHIEASLMSYLDLSNSSLHRFCFLPRLKFLEHLDLCSTVIGDDAIQEIASIGANFRYLNLCKTKISSAGIEILAGHVPHLEILLLSNTSVDDIALSYIGLMPSLKEIDLSNTNIKGTSFSKQIVQVEGFIRIGTDSGRRMCLSDYYMHLVWCNGCIYLFLYFLCVHSSFSIHFCFFGFQVSFTRLALRRILFLHCKHCKISGV